MRCGCSRAPGTTSGSYDNLSLGHRAAGARRPADRGRVDGPAALVETLRVARHRGRDALRGLRARRRVGRRSGQVLPEQRRGQPEPARGDARGGRRPRSSSPAPRPPTACPSGSRSPRTSRSSRSIPTALASWSSSRRWPTTRTPTVLAYAALRYFNAAGASADGDLGEDHDPETHLIPIVLRGGPGPAASRSRSSATTIPTPDGTCIRDYIHVDDLGAAHLAGARAARAGQGLAAQPGHRPRPQRARGDRRLPPRHRPRRFPTAIGPRRPGDPPELVADSTRAQQRAGLAAAVRRHRVDRADRLALAPGPSARVRSLICRVAILFAKWLAAKMRRIAAHPSGAAGVSGRRALRVPIVVPRLESSSCRSLRCRK